MPAAEPHPRRRALRRVLLTVVTAGLLVFGGSVPAAAQLLPTDPEPTTTAPEPETEETTTTTEDEPAPTTTRATTQITRATTTTRATADDEGDLEIDDDVVDGEPTEDDATVEDVPTETTSTARDVLVAGDGSDGAQATTTTSTTVVEVAADGGVLDEETQIWLIVAGLILVAALIGVWTWRYWVRTRPVATAPEADPTTVFPAR